MLGYAMQNRPIVQCRSALLVSLHDVSPITLAACKQAVGLLRKAAFPLESLTVLAIPFHEGQVKLCDHAGTIQFLKQLQDGGATLIMHGLTHRMPKHKFNLCAWPMAYGFARGQSEFYYSTESQAKTSLAASQSIMEKAGFSSAAKRFIPPAWLLSRACLVAVRQADYEFYELLDGIHWHDRVLAPRLIGWGSLTAIESHLTSTWAHLNSVRSPHDTRLVIHPVDMSRPVSRRSLVQVLSRMCEKLVPVSYSRYLNEPR